MLSRGWGAPAPVGRHLSESSDAPWLRVTKMVTLIAVGPTRIFGLCNEAQPDCHTPHEQQHRNHLPKE